MDVDLASVEIVFAQKLACGEPITRARALRVLHDWIREQSEKKQFQEEDLMRLCKGLHYVMWMQDKMVLQEELADRIGGLINIFTSEDEKVLYVKCFLKSLSKEWPHIDRWRMDKFLMEVRRMLRATFAHLRDLKWKKNIRDQYWNVFKDTVISSDKSFNEALKFHFASLLLDELDAAGGLTKSQVTSCIEPYINLLGVREISQYLFDSIIDEVFNTILLQKSEEIKAKNEVEQIEENEGIQFNYKEISKLLFNVGKKDNLNTKRRSRIYDLVKKFEKTAAGQDPLHFEPPKPKEFLTKEDYAQATERILKMNEEFKEERKKLKKAKTLLKANARLQQVEQKDKNDDVEETKEKSSKIIKPKNKKESIPKIQKGKKSFKKVVKTKGTPRKMKK